MSIPVRNGSVVSLSGRAHSPLRAGLVMGAAVQNSQSSKAAGLGKPLAGSSIPWKNCVMSTVAEIETALQTIPLDDARRVADWLQRYLDEKWDAQIDGDIDAGRLDK